MHRNGRVLATLTLLVMIGLLNSHWADGQQQQLYSNLSQRNPVAQSVEGGMWRTDQAFDSVLHMKNVLLTNELQVRPSLIMADGYILRLPTMIIPAAGVASVNITDALKHMDVAAQAHRSVYGMAGVDYSWNWPGAIMASIQNIDETAMLTFHSSLQSDRANSLASTKQREKAQVVNGTWWKPYDDADMFLFLGNSSDSSKSVSVMMLSNTGQILKEQQLSLSPRASIFLNAFRMLGKPPETGDTGSLIVSASGRDRSLVALAGIQDDANGYSVNLHLYEQHPEEARKKTVGSITMATPGVMLGVPQKEMQFPVSTSFQPYLILHNTSKTSRTVQISADYRLQARQQHILLGTVTLATAGVQQFSFPTSLSGVAPDLGTMSLSEAFNGMEGDIQVEAGSVDSTGNYVFEAETHTEAETISRTICYWSVQSDTDTMISLWNYSTVQQRLLLTLYYQGGKYKLPVTLAAGEQGEISVATLLHKQTPDQSGTVLPANLTEGSAILSSVDGEDKPIDLASSTSTYNVRNGTCTNSCGTCNGVTSVYVDPDTVQLELGSSLQTAGYMTYNTGSTSNVTSSAPWASSDTSMMTISSPGMMNGMAYGSANGFFTLGNEPVGLGYVCMGNSFSCPYNNYAGSAPVSIQSCPTSVSAYSNTPLPLSQVFPGDHTGLGAIVGNLVAGPKNDYAGTQLKETVILASNGCSQYASVPTNNSSKRPFTVGAAAEEPNQTVIPAQKNVFYDQFTLAYANSVLPQGVSCTIRYTQQYSCNGTNVGPTFNIVFTLQAGTYQGQNVTNVSASR